MRTASAPIRKSAGVRPPRRARRTGSRDLRLGFEDITRLLAGTLGPSRGAVLSQVGRSGSELLADSALIARRITAFPERGRSVGLAIARDMVRTVAERYGDGGATAAVLARAMLRHAVKVTAAGAGPVQVRAGIERGIEAACQALDEHAAPVDDVADLVGLASAVTGDAELSALVAEVLDVLGPDGAVQVEDCPAVRIEHDYLQGARWRARPAERRIIPEGRSELTLVEPAVVVADLEIERLDQVRRLLEVARALPGRPPLLVVARDITGTALTTLAANDVRGTVVSAPVVVATTKLHMSDDLADLALLTGAQVLGEQQGRLPERADPTCIGRAHRALVQRGYLTVTGGIGDPADVLRRVEALRTRVAELDGVGRTVGSSRGGRARSDPARRADDQAAERYWLRQARLAGNVAVLRVGAATELERDVRKDRARTAVRLLTTALREGVVAGGGVALLDCADAVEKARSACDNADEALGVDAVRFALDAPFLQIVRNAGSPEPTLVLANVRELGPGFGVDVRTNAYVRMADAGVRDVAGVVRGALRAAGGTAGLIVSAEVVDRHG